MKKGLKILMIGAHPDDNDICGGGTALRYLENGCRVRFLSVSDGRCGHHRLSPEETARRRKAETAAVAKLTGIEYDVWDVPDGEVTANLETRRRMIRYIRAYAPDVVFTHRTIDYHPDHRNASLLVQDASYMLTVPNFCPEAPAMRHMPVIMFFDDRFKNPVFVPDVVVATDGVIDKKFEMYHCHTSQMYEWLAYTHGDEALVPADPAKRLEWYRSPRIPRDRALTLAEIMPNVTNNHNEYREAIPAAKYRAELIKRYGKAGERIVFAEAFALSEYGAQLTEEKIKRLFPL